MWVREMKNAHNNRLRLVQHAGPRGIMPTARAFSTDYGILFQGPLHMLA